MRSSRYPAFNLFRQFGVQNYDHECTEEKNLLRGRPRKAHLGLVDASLILMHCFLPLAMYPVISMALEKVVVHNYSRLVTLGDSVVLGGNAFDKQPRRL